MTFDSIWFIIYDKETPSSLFCKIWPSSPSLQSNISMGILIFNLFWKAAGVKRNNQWGMIVIYIKGRKTSNEDCIRCVKSSVSFFFFKC